MKSRTAKDQPESASSRYFRDLRETPVLTHEEEVELAKQIESGERIILDAIAASPEATKELEALRHAPPDDNAPTGDAEPNRLGARAVERVLARLDALASGENGSKGPNPSVRETAKIVRRGRRRAREARAKLVQSNMRLVVWMAKKQLNRGLPLLDLVQEGNVGLMRAADKFDYRRGVRFNTYAVWWIRQGINRALSNFSRTIRMPVHLVETHRKVAQMLKHFASEHGREATAEEASEQTGIPLARIRELMDAPREPVSIDAQLGSESETTLSDLVADRTAISPIESIANERLPEQMRRILKTLTEREQQILKMRFGIDHPGGVTLQDIGNTFALSRERIRQIESQALDKLRELAEEEELDSHLAS